MNEWPLPDPELLDEYTRWMKAQGKAPRTIENYLIQFNVIIRDTDDLEAYFANQQLSGKQMKVFAYRSYLQFLAKKKQLISSDVLVSALETIKPPKKRGTNHSDKKWSIPKNQWSDYIRKAPHKVAKMGLWLGFQFGLRLGEIIHLRIDDIDFENKQVLIRQHKKSKYCEPWSPKHYGERQVPFTRDQAEVLHRWIDETRPKLDHKYLLWAPKHKGRIGERGFQYWCKEASLHPHVLRYSFATHYYNESKDVKLISDLLGHSSVAITSEYLCLGQKETMNKARSLFASS